MWTLVGCSLGKGKPMQRKITWSWFYLSSNSQWLYNPSRTARNTVSWALEPDVWGAKGEGLWQCGGGCLQVSGEPPCRACWRLMLSSGPYWPRATTLMGVSDLDSCQPACSVGLSLGSMGPVDHMPGVNSLTLLPGLPAGPARPGSGQTLAPRSSLLITAHHSVLPSSTSLACMVLSGGHDAARSSFAA